MSARKRIRTFVLLLFRMNAKNVKMSIDDKGTGSWGKEKEKHKLTFELIADKYSMFKEADKSLMSEKLQLRLAKTKEELHRIIAEI